MKRPSPASAARFMTDFKAAVDHFRLTTAERLACIQAARRDWGRARRCYSAIAGSLGSPERR